MIQSSNKLIVKDPFEMPAVDDTTVLVLRECVDLVPHCWIWNESVGYLEVVTYSGYDIYVTVKNVGMKENATSGTIFPSCMEFLITAPNATPIIDNTVTCLRADFKCPTVGQEALMSVDSTSAIRVGDIIIVDTRYQYLVTEIINEHTMKVLNEEKGKESGVIDVKCNECVPVKIFESTHCCEALQDQVDDIYNRLDTKKSIIPDADSLISVTNGSQSLTDAFNDVVLDVDTDLSKYDNTSSQFITLGDIPTGNLTSTSTNLVVSNGNGALLSDASLMLYTGSILPGSPVVTITNGSNRVLGQTNTSIEVETDLSKYDNSVSKFIKIGDVPPIPTVNDATLTIYESDGVTPFVSFSANAATAVTATLPASGTNLVYFKELYDTALTTARFVPNTSSVATSYSLGNSNNWINESYIENTRVKTLIGQNYTDGITYPSSNSVGHTVIYDAGTISQTSGRHEFRTGGNTVLTINENGEIVANGDIVAIGDIVPVSDNSGWVGRNGESFEEGWINEIHTQNIFPTTGNTSINIGGDLIPSSTSEDLGSNNNKWGNAYIDNLYANNMGNYVLVSKQGLSFNFSPGGGIVPSDYIFTPGNTYAGYSNTYTFSNTFSQTVYLEIIYNLIKFRLNISSGSGNNVTYELHLWWEYKSYQTGQSAPGSWSSAQSVTEYCQKPSAATHACTYSLAKTATGNINVQPNYTVQIRLLFSFQLIGAQGTVRTYSGWGPATDARVLGWLTN